MYLYVLMGMVREWKKAKIKKPLDEKSSGVLLSVVIVDYSATAALSTTAALSVARESTTLSTTSSIESVSTGAACSVLLPQAAKDTATTAANANTNFFIFSKLLNL
jgi:hypothetical protein